MGLSNPCRCSGVCVKALPAGDGSRLLYTTFPNAWKIPRLLSRCVTISRLSFSIFVSVVLEPPFFPLEATLPPQSSPSSALRQRNSRDPMALRTSPTSPNVLRTKGPGTRRRPECLASFWITKSKAFVSSVAATGLNSIIVVRGCVSTSGPRRRWAVKLSFEAVVAD